MVLLSMYSSLRVAELVGVGFGGRAPASSITGQLCRLRQTRSLCEMLVMVGLTYPAELLCEAPIALG